MKYLVLCVLSCAGVASAGLTKSRGNLIQDVCYTEECKLTAEKILEAMDFTVDPCEDFYEFSCGGWMEKNSIPEGKSKWGRFYELRDQVDQALKDILEMDEAGEATSVRNLREMYKGCMDTEAIEESGLTTLTQLVGDSASGWPMVQEEWSGDSFEIADSLGKARRSLGAAWIINLWVYLDDLDTEKNVIYVDQPDLGLPLAMYLDEESYKDYIQAYKQFITDAASVLIRELGSSVSLEALTASVENVYQFEKGIAQVMTPDSERRNSTAMYNPMTVAELKENYEFDWDAYLGQVFADTEVEVGEEERLIVVQPDYFASALQQIKSSKRLLADYIFSRFVMMSARELTGEMRDIAFKFTSVMTGANTQPDRWQTCTASATGGWGFAAAHEYVMRNFESESKAEADRMVEDLRAAFKELVGETEWMDEVTQVSALDKADRMLQLIGYPDWLVNEDQLDLYYQGSSTSDPSNHFSNVLAQLYWSTGKELKELGQVPERDVWLMHPAIVNAWYSPNHNTITFPAGILQPPFFQGGRPRYLNYGAMGMVIGHEITHGFDDQGRQYDGIGNLKPWWTEETLQGFIERAECFINQYGNFTVPQIVDIVGEEQAHLNGQNTQGENIADNGGIRESFRAYLKSLESQGEEPALPGLEEYSSKQMFFISSAQIWCEIQTDQSLLGQVLTDPHSPGRFRVLGPLSNSQDFQREWNCPNGSPMVRPERCQLW